MLSPAFVVATSKAKVGLQINPTFPLAPPLLLQRKAGSGRDSSLNAYKGQSICPFCHCFYSYFSNNKNNNKSKGNGQSCLSSRGKEGGVA